MSADEEMVLVRHTNGGFWPLTQRDESLVSKFCPGKAIRVKKVSLNKRSMEHHRLYWGGLIALTMQYWEPKDGLLHPAERKVLTGFLDYIDQSDSAVLKELSEAYLKELQEHRSAHIQAPSKSELELHRWIKVQAGYYELVITPSGIEKKAKSINFNAMKQEEFNDFYKAAFSVCWKLVLGQTFENEQEAENAVRQLLEMG